MDIMIGGDPPDPYKLLSKTSQIYVVGFPVMVLFLWSSTCDKHNPCDFRVGRLQFRSVSFFIFVEQTP
jgi:hypothetical protein